MSSSCAWYKLFEIRRLIFHIGNSILRLKVHHSPRHFEVKKANSKPSDKDKDHAKSGKASARQLSLFNTIWSGQKYERKSRKWQQLTDAVTFCLAKGIIPIYSVEKEGFVCLLHSLDFQHELPSCKYFSNVTIPKRNAQTRDVIAAEIKSAEFLGATTDMWSSYTTEPYLSYIQYILWGRTWEPISADPLFSHGRLMLQSRYV